MLSTLESNMGDGGGGDSEDQERRGMLTATSALFHLLFVFLTCVFSSNPLCQLWFYISLLYLSSGEAEKTFHRSYIE